MVAVVEEMVQVLHQIISAMVSYNVQTHKGRADVQ